MIRVELSPLRHYVAAILGAKGTPDHIATVVAKSLILSNQRGHDSHGFIRTASYCDWIDRGWVVPDAEPVFGPETDNTIQADGGFGFGQYVGRLATQRAIERAQGGHCILTLKRSGHLGRVGEFMEQAADCGIVAIAFTNTHGGGLVAAPHGGAERRLGANPISAGAPLPDRDDPLMMDISTSSIAAGKIRVAAARNAELEAGHLVDAAGQPTTDPHSFDADPQGALLPVGRHKGYCLSMFCEVLAGALTGAGCSTAGVDRVANGFFALFLDPAAFCGDEFYHDQLAGLIPHVKSAKPMAGYDEVLLPGEPEARNQAAMGETLSIEDSTWQQAAEVATDLGVSVPPAA
jgi:uncharacterized oxidoreductase